MLSTKRLFSVLILLAVLSLFAIAWNPAAEPVPPTAPEGTLRVALSTFPNSLFVPLG